MVLEHQQTMTVEEYFQLEEITLSSLCIHFSLADACTDVEFEGTTEEA
jgi:hypothetical protein